MNEIVKPTQQALFDRFVNLYHEQATINLDIKSLSDEFKEHYPDAELATIKSVARAKAEESLAAAKVKLADAQDALIEKGKVAAQATDDYVHEKPWHAVGIAAGVGLVIGLLIGRR